MFLLLLGFCCLKEISSCVFSGEMYCRTTRAVSEINPVPLGRGCGRSPSVTLDPPWLILPTLLGQTPPGSSVTQMWLMDFQSSASVYCVSWKQSPFCLQSESCKSRLTEGSWKEGLEDSGGKGIPGRLQPRVGIWRCGAHSLCVPVCPVMWGLTDQAEPKSKWYSDLLYPLLLWWDWWKLELSFPFH